MRTTNLLPLAALAATVMACHGRQQAMAPATAEEIDRTLARQSVDAVIYQYASAEVYLLYQQCYELARVRLDENLARPHDLPPAVIVDVDETVLDNSLYQVTAASHGRTFDPDTWTEWTQRARAKALPGAVAFLRYAASRGCAVFYITNRSEAEKAATLRNLADVGFPMADAEHVMVMAGTSDKTERRAAVAKDHYVALLVGDQLTDMDQSFKDRRTGDGRPHVDELRDTLNRYFIMLPNPMYGTWLDAVAGRSDSLKAGNKERFLHERAY